jgi:hypothetical protein
VVVAAWNATGGNHTIKVHGDSTFIVDEIDETNNRGRKSIYVNYKPLLHVPAVIEGNEGQLIVVDADATDPDGGSLVFYTNAEEVLPGPFSFSSSTGVLEWIPAYQDQGQYLVKFNVTDGIAWDSREITITVNDVPAGGGSPFIMKAFRQAAGLG